MSQEYPHERKVDKDKVSKYNEFWDRYRNFVIPILWTVCVWFATQLYPAVKAYPQIISRLDETDRARSTMLISINILIRMQCLQLDAVDRAKINLDCAAIPLPMRKQIP